MGMSIISNILLKIKNRNHISILLKRGLVVGKNFWLGQGSIIDPDSCWLINIGNDVIFAPRVHILAHDASTKKYLGYTRIGKVRIGDRVFIGASSIIMPGVTIENDVIVGAGSVVTKDISSRTVVAGNPARVICTLDDFLKKRKKEMGEYPIFEQEYNDGQITDKLKIKMKDIIKNKYGYLR